MSDNQNQNGPLDELLDSEQDPIQSDNQLTDEEPNVRNHEYTELIKNYNLHIKRTLNFKQMTRWISFIVFNLLFLTIFAFSIDVINVTIGKDKTSYADIAVIISSMASLISAIVVLPGKIIDFVYNKDEEAYIVDIIKHTQEFDKKENN